MSWGVKVIMTIVTLFVVSAASSYRGYDLTFFDAAFFYILSFIFWNQFD